MTDKAPDIAGTVEGWRAWGIPAKLPRYGNPPKLYSLTHRVTSDITGERRKYFWVPREAAEAHCQIDPYHVPGEKCSCGFYSAKNLKHLMSMGYHSYDAQRSGMFHVVGKVANWGKIVEGSQGWRAQFSYPVELYVPFEAHHLALPLQETYGVNVQLRNVLKVPA